MQHLSTLWKIAGAASDVVEMTRSAETYRFPAPEALTLYLHTAHAEVRVQRWDEPRVEIEARLQAPFGWRVRGEQDEAGIYFVAFRRPVVGGLAGASFRVHAPPSAFLVLRLDHARLVLDDVVAQVELPGGGAALRMLPAPE